MRACSAGIHFRTGCEQGIRMGEQVGRFVIQHALKPVKKARERGLTSDTGRG